MPRLPTCLPDFRACAAPRRATWLLAALTLLLAGVPSAPAQTPLLEADRLIAEADAMWWRGDLRIIERRLREALAIQSAWLPEGDRRLAFTRSRLCRNAWNQGDFAAADAECREALAILEAHERDTLWHARILGDLGAALRMQGRHVEAEAPVRRSVGIRRALLAPGDAWLGSGLDNLARVLAGQDRIAPALDAAEEALAIRSAVLGEGHDLTRDTRALVLDLRTETYRRQVAAEQRANAARRVALLSLGGVLMLFGTAHGEVQAERQGGPDRWRVVRSGLVLAASVVIGVALTHALGTLLAWHLPDMHASGWLPNLGYIFGFVLGVVLHHGAANVMRRHAKLPRRPLVQRTTASPQPALPADIRDALWRAHEWITFPGVGVFFAVLLSMFAMPLTSQLSGLDLDGLAPILVPGWFLAACLGAWWWWSRTIVRWRIWALRRVADIDLLERAAIEAGFLGPTDGIIGATFTKTERWTPAQRRLARRLRRGRGGPAWSGDL